jgi:hypothetical protein
LAALSPHPKIPFLADKALRLTSDVCQGQRPVDLTKQEAVAYDFRLLPALAPSHLSLVSSFAAGVPAARTPNDYVELIGSLYVAWLVAHQWPTRPEVIQQFQQAMIPTRNAIRVLLKVDKGLDPLVRQYLERREQRYAAFANYSGETLLFEGFEGPGLPKRRDHLTFADLGRKRRGAGLLLFVREASLAMRAIFDNPHDKVVGQLAGLAFGTKALSPETVRSMCKKKPVQFDHENEPIEPV